jgi:hypothetical protein
LFFFIERKNEYLKDYIAKKEKLFNISNNYTVNFDDLPLTKLMNLKEIILILTKENEELIKRIENSPWNKILF